MKELQRHDREVTIVSNAMSHVFNESSLLSENSLLVLLV